MASGLYPGIGTPLYLASSNAEEPVWAGMRDPTEAIPDGSYSIGVPLNAGITTTLNVLYGTAPTSTAFEIRYDVNKDFSTEYVLDSVAAVASQKVYTWSVSDVLPLSGFIRIKNTGGQTASNTWAQQAATFSS